MRAYSGPRGGYVHPVTPIPVVQAPVAPPPEAIVAPAPAAEAGPSNCPHCGAALPTPDAEYCPQCGEATVAGSTIVRVRRFLSNRYFVGALALVFVLLLAGIVLAGQVSEVSPSIPSTGASVGTVLTPTPTATAARPTTPVVTATPRKGATTKPANASWNTTPIPFETVLVVKTLDRYVQNVGGDASQIRTPTPRATPTEPTPVPTSASAPVGELSWSGEGTFVTDLFALDAGPLRVDMTAGVLTMAQLRDASGTAIGIATAGPQPSSTTLQVPLAGTYRLEVWPFGLGAWTVSLSYPSPTAMPTLPPTTIPTMAPPVNNTTEVPTTGAETPTPTASETATTVATESPTPTPTQNNVTFESNDTQAVGPFTLNEGPALVTYTSETNGTFALTLIGDEVSVIVPETEGPVSGSQWVMVPTTGEYRLNVIAVGRWIVSIS